MDLTSISPGFETFALCSVILALKMMGSAVYTATRRGAVGGYVNSEDAKLGGKGATAGESEKTEVAHALRIQRNDVENIPLFWVVGLLYVLTGASAFGAAVYCWTFTIARIAHTFAYVNHKQPARALLWLLGCLCVIGMSVQVIWRAL